MRTRSIRLKALITSCYRGLMRGAWVLVAALAFAAASQAQLQRFLPNDGHYGELHDQRQQPLPLLQIDKKILRLAPGGRIYDQQKIGRASCRERGENERR